MTALTNPASWLTGYIADLPTPFDGDAEPDLNAFAALCTRQIDAGASAIIVGETAGEASTLTAAEKLRLVRCAVETVQGRARVIAGAGSNSTDRAIELTRQAERAGADAVLSVVPYYNKPMQEGMVAHFRAIAASTALPVILHDIPARTSAGCPTRRWRDWPSPCNSSGCVMAPAIPRVLCACNSGYLRTFAC